MKNDGNKMSFALYSGDGVLTDDSFLNEWYIDRECKILENTCNTLSVEEEKQWLLKAITLLDLTSLSADDTKSIITKLCCTATSPLSNDLSKICSSTTPSVITTASVCVYPNRITDAKEALNSLNSKLPIAAVAGGFPSGQYPLATRVGEIIHCVKQGADEVDIVVDRSLILTQEWGKLFEEVKTMVNAGQGAKIKVILAVGECGSWENIFKASIVSMHAGAHFIKTSTGKEAINATLPVGIVMCRAIKMILAHSGHKVGFKPAGGIRTYQDVLMWMMLIKRNLGEEWIDPELFRIGASSVLLSIVDRLNTLSKIVGQ